MDTSKKQKEQTASFTPVKFRTMRLKLERICEDLKEAEKAAEKSGFLWCFKDWSANSGMRSLTSFATDLRESVYAAESGEPYNAGTRKEGAKVVTPSPEELGKETLNAAAAKAAKPAKSRRKQG